MIEIHTKGLKLVPLSHKFLEIWYQKGREAMEMALGILPNEWVMSPDIQRETTDALANFWLIQTLQYPEYFAWFTNWEIILKSENRSIGGMGFAGYPDDGQTDIGYLISENETNKGYATEAVAGLLDWAFKEPKLQMVKAQTPFHHIASQRVLIKNNFTNMGTIYSIELMDKVFLWEKLRK